MKKNNATFRTLSFYLASAFISNISAAQEYHEIIDCSLHNTSQDLENWLSEKFTQQITKPNGLIVTINNWVMGQINGQDNNIKAVYFSDDGSRIYICSDFDKTLIYDLTSQQTSRVDPRYFNFNVEPFNGYYSKGTIIAETGINGASNQLEISKHKYKVNSPDGTYTLHFERIKSLRCYYTFYIDFNTSIKNIASQNLTPDQVNILGIIQYSDSKGKALCLITPDRSHLHREFRKLSPSLQLFLNHAESVITYSTPTFVNWLGWLIE